MRKIFKASTVALGMICACLLVGCDDDNGNRNNNQSAPDLVNKISSPYVRGYGDCLTWEPVKNADVYYIYQDGKKIGESTEGEYVVGALETDSEFYIVAEDKDKNIQSKNSNTVTVSKNCNYTAEEILDLSKEDTWSGDIEATVRQVILQKDATVTANFKLKEREQDITFVLENTQLVGENVIEDLQLDYDCPYGVIIQTKGTSSIQGKEGYHNEEVFPVNSQKDGVNGGDGGNAIYASNVVIQGEGDLTIAGGHGGKGSNGADTSAYKAYVPGRGSHGGDGGDGIVCKTTFVNMDKKGTVTISAGKGGAKGNMGKNGSIMTGLWVDVGDFLWQNYDIGKAGEDGVSVSGIVLTRSGKATY
ncbi:MAG: hypothetical protein IJX49_03060 [Clostridia bacterium]|nr:hypothetical protein [Clostridia bacterium]